MDNETIIYAGIAVIFFILIIAAVGTIIFFGSRPQTGTPCNTNSDCDNDHVCNQNQCRVATGGNCNKNSDCIVGDLCMNSICMRTDPPNS